jgi:hypothetical protein
MYTKNTLSKHEQMIDKCSIKAMYKSLHKRYFVTKLPSKLSMWGIEMHWEFLLDSDCLLNNDGITFFFLKK